MADECVVAVYKSLQNAESAVHVLHRGDFPSEQISLIASDLEEHPDAIADLSMEDDSIRDAALGAGLGGVLGVLAGVTAMAASGLGLVFLVGPVGGGLFGAVTGSLIGAIEGWGIHKTQREHYDRCLKNGDVLVIAEGDAVQIAKANRILKETDPREIHVHAKTDSESPEVNS